MFKYKQIVNSLFSSNTFILYQNDCSDAWLIDCGDYGKVKKWLLESQKELKGIFVTHGHFDHVYGINEALKDYPDLTIYLSRNEGIHILGNVKLNGSKYIENSFTIVDANFVELKDGDLIELVQGELIKIIETVGHSVDSVSYSVDNYLFTGDAFIPNIRPVSKIKGGDREVAKKTTIAIYEMCTEETIICPGHKACTKKKDVNINYML